MPADGAAEASLSRVKYSNLWCAHGLRFPLTHHVKTQQTLVIPACLSVL